MDLILIWSDKRSSFMAEITQKVSKVLFTGLWKLHLSWRAQSTGKSEKMKYILKRTIAKLCQGTHLVLEVWLK
jgi:hypothetical protein